MFFHDTTRTISEEACTYVQLLPFPYFISFALKHRKICNRLFVESN